MRRTKIVLTSAKLLWHHLINATLYCVLAIAALALFALGYFFLELIVQEYIPSFRGWWIYIGCTLYAAVRVGLTTWRIKQTNK